MVTTNLGKMPNWRQEKIIGKIYDILMSDGALLNTEVLYYFLVDDIGVPHSQATRMALKIHGGGREVNSRYIQDALLEDSDSEKGVELERRQVAHLIKRFIKSTRVETLDKTPTCWRMNGFSTHEKPYISGYEREINKIRKERGKKLDTLINKRESLKEELNQYEQQLSTGFDITTIQRKIKIRNKIDRISQEIDRIRQNLIGGNNAC